MLVSAKHQQESAIGIYIYIYIYIYIPSLLNLPPIPPHPTPLGCYRAPVRIPWVTQQIPIGYLFYIW